MTKLLATLVASMFVAGVAYADEKAAPAPAKTEAKAPAKAEAKAPAKAEAKDPAKAEAKAPAKAEAKKEEAKK